MPRFTIDSYCTNDYPAVCRLWQASGMPDMGEEEIAGVCAHGGQLIVARDSAEGQIVGTVMWTFDGARACVRKVAVDTHYQRQGIAITLMEEARRQMRDAGVKKAILFTSQNNTAAQALYAKVGWTLWAPSIESWAIEP